MGLSFGGGLFGSSAFIPTGYSSKLSGQTEVSAFLAHTGGGAYETIYTVTTGKSFYISAIISTSLNSNDDMQLAQGAVASESNIIVHQFDVAGIYPTVQTILPIPIKILSGTRLSVNASDNSTTTTIIGYEE